MSDEADEVLAHSEDDGEWDDAPVAIERRPAGSQVVSARVPDALADLLFAEVARRNGRLSDLVRAALEEYLRPRGWDIIKIMPGNRVRFPLTEAIDTTNPTVTEYELPPLRALA